MAHAPKSRESSPLRTTRTRGQKDPAADPSAPGPPGFEHYHRPPPATAAAKIFRVAARFGLMCPNTNEIELVQVNVPLQRRQKHLAEGFPRRVNQGRPVPLNQVAVRRRTPVPGAYSIFKPQAVPAAGSA